MGFGVAMTRVHTWAPLITSSCILAKLHDLSGPPCFQLYNVRWDSMQRCL